MQKILLPDGQPSNPRRRKKKKISFQQEMKVKTTEINNLTFEMGKNKHIVIDVQRDRVNRQQQFPTPLVRNMASLKGRPIFMYLCLSLTLHNKIATKLKWKNNEQLRLSKTTKQHSKPVFITSPDLMVGVTCQK